MATEVTNEAAGGATVEETEGEVNPWEVKGKVDYDKLIEKFGCSAISEEQVQKIEKVTGKKVGSWGRG